MGLSGCLATSSFSLKAPFLLVLYTMGKNKTKKDVYYFSHDFNPTSDPKMLAFVGEYGAVGYGIYWRIVEMLHESSEHVLPLKKYIYSALAKQMLTDVEQVFKIVESCINDYELFETDDEYFWCNRVLRNVEKRIDLIAKKVKAGEASAEARKNKKIQEENIACVQHNSTDVQHVLTDVQHNLTEGNKLNEIKLNETKKNNINSEISKKIALPFKFSDISNELKTNSKTKEFCIKTYFIKESEYDRFIDWFIGTKNDHSDNEIVDFKIWNIHFKEWMKFNYNKLPQAPQNKTSNRNIIIPPK